jgi:riboflavin biosynthesis pyrimidine reductase
VWIERFERFAAAKVRAAEDARLWRFVTEGEDARHGLEAIDDGWTKELFDGPFYQSSADGLDSPAVSLVFVQSKDGNTVAADPSALGGGETDKHLIYEGLSRVSADAVLAGAGTVRGGDIFFSVWHPELVRLRASLGLPRHPIQIVATLLGLPIDETLLFNVPSVETIVVTTEPLAASMRTALGSRPWVTTIVMEKPADMPVAFRLLRARGISRLSCVGGRTLARQLLDAGLVDDVYLTTAARPGGEPGTPLHPGSWRGSLVTRKHGTGPDAGVIFEHVLPARRPSA